MIAKRVVTYNGLKVQATRLRAAHTVFKLNGMVRCISLKRSIRNKFRNLNKKKSKSTTKGVRR